MLTGCGSGEEPWSSFLTVTHMPRVQGRRGGSAGDYLAVMAMREILILARMKIRATGSCRQLNLIT
jgi:hypothetical protein